MNLFDLSDRSVIVTGAGRGIGRALALGLAQAGANLVICARSRSELESLANQVEQMGRKALVAVTDIRQRDQVDGMVQAALAQYGCIDILVNNVGIALPQPAEQITEEAWDEVVDTNLKGTFFVSQAVARAMISRRRGVIINLASELAFVALPGYACYSATKAGIVMLTRALAAEWARYGIRVNAVAPAAVQTEANSVLATEDDRAQALARLPIGRFGSVQDMVGAVIYLASDAASYVLGETIMVDGGRVII
ncbi:MAG: glucose 1-dehydrogenase [Chloroflexi bacterium]|nr:glucose 1-dehydrogenase [Chloroflexota bacterium]